MVHRPPPNRPASNPARPLARASRAARRGANFQTGIGATPCSPPDRRRRRTRTTATLPRCPPTCWATWWCPAPPAARPSCRRSTIAPPSTRRAHARGDGTRRVYRSAWRTYVARCQSLGREPLAGDPELLAMYAGHRRCRRSGQHAARRPRCHPHRPLARRPRSRPAPSTSGRGGQRHHPRLRHPPNHQTTLARCPTCCAGCWPPTRRQLAHSVPETSPCCWASARSGAARSCWGCSSAR